MQGLPLMELQVWDKSLERGLGPAKKCLLHTPRLAFTAMRWDQGLEGTSSGRRALGTGRVMLAPGRISRGRDNTQAHGPAAGMHAAGGSRCLRGDPLVVQNPVRLETYQARALERAANVAGLGVPQRDNSEGTGKASLRRSCHDWVEAGPSCATACCRACPVLEGATRGARLGGLVALPKDAQAAPAEKRTRGSITAPKTRGSHSL